FLPVATSQRPTGLAFRREAKTLPSGDRSSWRTPPSSSLEKENCRSSFPPARSQTCTESEREVITVLPSAANARECDSGPSPPRWPSKRGTSFPVAASQRRIHDPPKRVFLAGPPPS